MYLANASVRHRGAGPGTEVDYCRKCISHKFARQRLGSLFAYVDQCPLSAFREGDVDEIVDAGDTDDAADTDTTMDRLRRFLGRRRRPES